MTAGCVELRSTLPGPDELDLVSLFDRVREDGGVVTSGVQGTRTDASVSWDEELRSDGVDAEGDAISALGRESLQPDAEEGD